MLISSGDERESNCMTASWGGFGVLWNKNVAFVFVRPVRHTYKFMESQDFFSLSFFNEESRRILKYCGSNSGKSVNKIKELSLHPVYYENQTIIYEEADLTLICRKIYADDLDPRFFKDKDIDKNYPDKDYHRMYIGEIRDILAKN